MTLKEHFYLIRSKIFRKNNVIFMLVMIVLLLILFISLGIMQLFLSFKINSERKDIGVRSLNVFEEYNSQNIEKLKNIEHVRFVGSDRLYHSVFTHAKEFDKSFATAYIKILPVIDENQLKVVSGKKQINNGEALCPMKFYPYDDMAHDYIVDSEVIKGKNLINRTFTSETVKDYLLNPDDVYYKEFKIVGVYDQSYNMASLDRCYITIDDFLEIAPLYSSYGEWTDIDGNIHREAQEFNSIYVVVDDYKNVSSVMNELRRLEFVFESASGYDEEDSALYVIVPLFISIAIMIIVINIIHNFNNKKMKQRMTYYGLLKAIGYDNQTIEKNQLLESIICYMISFVISFSIVLIGFILVKKYLLFEYVLEGLIINFPLLILICGFVITLFILFIINKKILNKRLKYTAQELIRDEI